MSEPRSGRDWSAWIDTIETKHRHDVTSCVVLVGIDLPELIRLKLSLLMFIIFTPIKVGIDLPELIRLKLLLHQLKIQLKIHRRDWSAWIDTIETAVYPSLVSISLTLSGLICLNWYDWNSRVIWCFSASTLESGLICLNWYDWNLFGLIDAFNSFNWVGIDLPELIRLKQ